MDSLDMFTEYPDVVGTNELCKMLNIGKNSAYDLLQGRKIKSVRMGSKYLIPKKCVIEYINKEIE